MTTHCDPYRLPFEQDVQVVLWPVQVWQSQDEQTRPLVKDPLGQVSTHVLIERTYPPLQAVQSLGEPVQVAQLGPHSEQVVLTRIVPEGHATPAARQTAL